MSGVRWVVGAVLGAGLWCGLVGSASAALAAQPATDPAYKLLIEERGPAVVSIRYILKLEGQQQEEEAPGVMVEPTGLVLTQTPGGIGARAMGMAPTPSEVKVLIGDDTQGVDAKVVAQDKELGLAWLQLDTPAQTPYAFVDFSSSGTANVGDTVYMVSLMGKFFGNEPMVSEGKIAASVTKPRRLLMPAAGATAGETSLGLPVFDATGKVLGIATFILPDREEMESGDMRTAMRGGFMGGMILPAAEVVEATARAKEMAKNPPAEEPAEEPKPEDKPAEPPAEPSDPPPATPK
jgi:S1-C subfamily serine protease